MAESDTTDSHAQPAPSRFERSAADRIREYEFPLAVRGYDRQAVDDFVDQVVELVSELEGRQTRESVVQRALNEVGEETAGILQRAHETADEIAARSRAQAEGRLQRAEREAEIVRRQADEYSEQVVVDTRLLWEERQRLLDDLRQLADEVLATADDAAERVSLPEQLGPAEEPVPDELTEQATTEVELDVLPGGAGMEEPQPTQAFEQVPGPPDETLPVDPAEPEEPALPEEPEEPEITKAEPQRPPRAGNDE
jgi:cell division initiation protein